MATFRKLPSGNWQARVMIDGKYKPIGTFKSKKQAQIEANKIEEKIYYGESLDDREMTFDDLVKRWLKYKRINVREKTYTKNEMIARVHLLPYFNNKKIFKIKRADILEWIKVYAKKDYTYNTKRKYYTALKDVFNYAVNVLEVLPTNPCTNLKLPKPSSKPVDKHYTLDELNQLLDYLEKRKPQKHKEYNLYYVLCYFLSRTGLRISEAIGLTWDDLNDNMLTIDKQVYRDKENKDVIAPLKNDPSYRKIKLDSDTINLLKEFKLMQNKAILKYNTFTKSEDNIMFQTNTGSYLNASEVRANLKIYCDNANVDYKGTHVFRHTHAILSLEAGATLEYISKRLGHKSIKTTADEYTDITPKIESDELDKVESYMARKWHDSKTKEK